MDLRDLLNRLDTIDQKQLLAEAEELMEKVGLRLEDFVNAVRGIQDDNERAVAIGKIAKERGFSGLFDPLTGKFVNDQGKFAWFGAYEEEVKRLASKGLIPDAAKTSAVLGLMGQSEKDAKPASQKAEALYKQIDQADSLIKKALEVPAAPAQESISESLLKEFGIDTTILEAITPDEHKLIKKTRQDIEPLLKQSDGDAVEFKGTYDNYIKQRDQLIAQIKKLIETIKALGAKAEKPAEAPKAGDRSGSSATQESLQESKQRMISEGRVIVLEDGTFVKDGQRYFYNESNDTYFYHDENGVLVERSASEFWQDAKDTGRGVLSGALFGQQDAVVAGALSILKGTSYKEELKKQIKATDAARERSPWLYTAGELGGWFLNPLTKTPAGAIAGATTSVASALGGREYVNNKLLGTQQPSDHPVKTQPKSDPKVAEIQKQLKAKGADLGTTGPNKDGVDGVLGNKTRIAMQQYGLGKELQSYPKPLASNSAASLQGLNQEQVLAVANKLGITLPGNITPEQIEKLATAVLNPAAAGVQESQIDEAGEALLSKLPAFLRGLASGEKAAGTAADIASGVKGAGSTADAATATTRAATKAADTIPNTLRYDGEVWDKVGNVYKARGADKTVSVDNMMRQLGRAEGPGAQGLRAQNAVDDMVRSGLKGAPEVEQAIAAEAGAITKLGTELGPKASTFLQRLKLLPAKFGAWLRNPKFLALMAILGLLGAVLTGGEQPVNPQPAPGPGPGPNNREDEEKKKEEERKRQLSELNSLLNRLFGGWPTDPETAQTIQEAIAVGATAPTGFSREGSGAQPANSSAGYQNQVNADTDEIRNRMVNNRVLPPGMASDVAPRGSQ